MKAYSFRLAGVARVRHLQEGIAAQGLATATREVAAAKAGLATATTLLEQLAVPDGTTSVDILRWTGDQADRMGESCRAHASALEAAESRRVVAREQWLAARRRCAVLERLDARRRSEWQTEFDRSEAKELDDIASGRAIGLRGTA
jgi:flagellar export protein FliJ